MKTILVTKDGVYTNLHGVTRFNKAFIKCNNNVIFDNNVVVEKKMYFIPLTEITSLISVEDSTLEDTVTKLLNSKKNS